MRCASIMHRPVVTVDARASARDAAELMRAHGIGFLPVCDAEGRAVGVVTDRDLAVRVCAAGGDAAKVPMAGVMTREVVACRATDRIVCVEELMIRHKKQRILVLDEGGRPAGVIAVADLAAHDRYETVARTYRKIVTQEL
ncbi:MAG TPA: CBS domain-containing protein [Ideonella sp.]|nr:CBS domain-containing protein [Ideonella sp.]